MSGIRQQVPFMDQVNMISLLSLVHLLYTLCLNGKPFYAAMFVRPRLMKLAVKSRFTFRTRAFNNLLQLLFNRS